MDHIFRRESGPPFVAALGLNFLTQYFLRPQWTEGDYRLYLPLPAPEWLDGFVVNTDGCWLTDN